MVMTLVGSAMSRHSSVFGCGLHFGEEMEIEGKERQLKTERRQGSYCS